MSKSRLFTKQYHENLERRIIEELICLNRQEASIALSKIYKTYGKLFVQAILDETNVLVDIAYVDLERIRQRARYQLTLRSKILSADIEKKIVEKMRDWYRVRHEITAVMQNNGNYIDIEKSMIDLSISTI